MSELTTTEPISKTQEQIEDMKLTLLSLKDRFVCVAHKFGWRKGTLFVSDTCHCEMYDKKIPFNHNFAYFHFFAEDVWAIEMRPEDVEKSVHALQNFEAMITLKGKNDRK
jgi:hypothetical protein